MGRLAVLLAVAAGFWVLLRFLVPLLWPFLLAFLLAEAMEPMVRLGTARGWGRPLAALASLGLLLMIFLTLGLSLLGRLLLEMGQLLQRLPAIRHDALVEFNRLVGNLVPWLAHPQSETDLVDLLLRSLFGQMGQILGLILAWAAALPGLLFFGGVSLLGAYFLSRDRPVIRARLWQALPPPWRLRWETVQASVMRKAWALLRGEMLLVGGTALLSAFGFLLLGNPFALILGLLAGLLDLLPVLGPGLLFLPLAFYHLTMGPRLLGLALLGLYGLLAAVRQVLEIRVVGRQTGLHPLASLLSLYLGSLLLGPAGFVAGPFLAVVLLALWESMNATEPNEPTQPWKG